MHYFSGKGCSESLESMHYCIGILNESFLTESAEEKEVMFFNFNATAPDIQKFYNHICKKINKDNDEIGCESDSVCSIMSYEKFYSLAQSGLDHVDGTCC